MSEKRVLRVLIVDTPWDTNPAAHHFTRPEFRSRWRNDGQGDTRLKPDIVLLDVVIPKMNGLDVLAKLKATNSMPLVLMVTSAEEEKVVSQAMQLGASGYILKPFNTTSVLFCEVQRSSLVRPQIADFPVTSFLINCHLQNHVDAKPHRPRWLLYWRD